MPAFEYAALDPSGQHKKGISQGESERQIRQQLRKQGLTPLSVLVIEKKQSTNSAPFWSRQHIPTSEISLMTRQLATLVRAGLPLDDALQALSEQVEHPEVKRMVLTIRTRVTEGHSLSEAMNPYSYALTELYIATVSAGEYSRDLALVLERLADYSETRQALSQKIRIAMMYPAILAITAMLVTAGLLIYVVPEIVQVFEHSEKQLPLITQILISVSNFMQTWWGLLLFLSIAFFAFAKWLLNKPAIKYRWHEVLLAMPMIKSLLRQADAARLTRTLGILLESGVPMLDALKIGCRSVNSLPIKESIEHATIKVREGEPLHQALKETKRLPPLTIHLVANGEASGNLESMLKSAAEAHERNLQNQISTFLGLLEPILILLMGSIVLTIVIAILLPIFELNQLV